MKTAFPILTHQTVYNYDVLNRIKSMNGYYRTGTETALTPSEYNSTYSYDANGNIVSMTNFAKADDGTKKQMDAFSYNYLANTNQLLSVDDDNLLTNNFSGDVDDQQTSNYGFDEIGQLIKDEAEKIEQITWTVTNKVKEVIYKGDLQGKKIRFDYDAMGHRIAKHVTSITGDVSSTYYVLDAQGNAMSTYTLTTKSESTFANKLVLSERNIYGSKRLGIEQLSKIVAEPRIVFTDVPWEQEGPWDFPWGNAPWEPIRWSRYYEDWSWTRNQPTVTIHAYKQEIGDKRYELANHLGNVLNVVTDRKLPVADANDNTKVSYFTGDVVSYSDYLPFGQLAPNRHGSEGSYRYGFNGKLKDDEIKGEGNSLDFGARIYDPRLGRWLAVDPLANKLPYASPYCFVLNKPTIAVDPDGKYPKIVITSEVTGYTIQGLKGVDNKASDPAIVVPTYKAIIYDVQKDGTEKVMGSFNVTRDGWYALGQTESETHLLNRAFEPADGNQNLYTAEWTPSFPTSKSGIDGFYLERFGDRNLPAEPLETLKNDDGTNIDAARKDNNFANNVMIHIGGTYEVLNWDHLGGALGCFAFIPAEDVYSTKEQARKASINDDYDDATSNGPWNYWADKILNLIEQSGKNKGRIEVEVNKRSNYEKSKTVNNNQILEE